MNLAMFTCMLHAMDRDPHMNKCVPAHGQASSITLALLLAAISC